MRRRTTYRVDQGLEGFLVDVHFLVNKTINNLVQRMFIDCQLTNSSSFSVALGTADVKPAFLLVAAIV